MMVILPTIVILAGLFAGIHLLQVLEPGLRSLQVRVERNLQEQPSPSRG